MFRIEKKIDYKNKINHSLTNHIFPKGLTHALGKKKCQFLNLFSVKTGLEIVLTEFVDKTETFSYHKN